MLCSTLNASAKPTVTADVAPSAGHSRRMSVNMSRMCTASESSRSVRMRISTAEVESALVSHPSVAEAAVVGANDATTGQAIIAYVILRAGFDVDEQVLRDHVAAEIGAIAKPKTIYLTLDLPKTRSGKIMRRLLRDVAEGRNIGDTSTLADSSIVDELQARAAIASED